MTRTLATAAAALLLASCYDPGGQCEVDTDCLSDQICGPDAICVLGTRPPPGQSPTAVADTYPFTGRGPFDVTAQAGVLKNDTDPTGGTLTAELVALPTYGTVYLAPDGSFTYSPVLNFNGTDRFTYRAIDGVLTSAAVAVTLTVVGPPIARPDAYSMSAAAGPLSVAARGVLVNDSDPNDPTGASLTAQLASNAVNGVVVVAANGSFTYTPTVGFTGTDTFTYRATVGTLASDPTVVTITVAP